MSISNRLKRAGFFTVMVLFTLVSCLPQSGTNGTANAAPEDAEPGSCWQKLTRPAIVSVKSRSVARGSTQIGRAGTTVEAQNYDDKTTSQIVEPRRVEWIELVCSDQFDAEFTSAVQRALAARGYYRGAIDGALSPMTRAAIGQYQREIGINSTRLSLAGARSLGLVPVVISPPQAD